MSKLECSYRGGIAMDYEYKGIRLGDGVEKALDKLERKYIEFDKLFNALIYRKKNEEVEEAIYIHILVGRVVFIHIRDKDYYPAEDIKIGTIITEELKEKYALYYDEDEYFDVYLSKKYPKFALVLEIVDYVNYMNYKERICGYTFDDQDSFDHFHKDRVENPLESKKLEDVYHSLRMKGTIDVDIEKREIIGELNNYKFIFDLITRDIKSIQNMETGEFLRTSM